jgi:methionyl aminopeptidase|tara:strand:- start:79 stop:969 length:891 start_codon:yes stop_codon:yes gene_type:complete
MEQEAIDKFKEAGKISAQALEYGRGLIKKDVLLLEVVDKVEAKIFELGAKPAFPAQISMNHIAAHYCPNIDDKTVFSDQVVSLDVGAHVDGFIGDNAVTVDLSGEHENLLNASKEALEEALKFIKIGVATGEIGRVIHKTISDKGFSPVRNLSGHGLGRYVQHDKPSIPNFDTGDKTKIEKGMVFAVEPFASTGSGIVQDSGEASVYMMLNKKPVRSLITRQVLKEIESYEEMPFCRRWLVKKFGAKANFGLRELQQLDMIKAYPPLVDSNKGLVSQAEHSVLIDDEGQVVVLTKI